MSRRLSPLSVAVFGAVKRAQNRYEPRVFAVDHRTLHGLCRYLEGNSSRDQSNHAVGLVDMIATYSDIVSSDEILNRLGSNAP